MTSNARRKELRRRVYVGKAPLDQAEIDRTFGKQVAVVLIALGLIIGAAIVAGVIYVRQARGASLVCTLPTKDAAVPSCSDGGPLTGLAYLIVSAERQSPTWITKRDSMLSDPASWARWWPTVREEAAEVRLSRTAVESVTGPYVFTPALNWRPAWVRVRTEDFDGNESCPSAWVWIP